ncbi:MAG: terpene cyclase/mutase family protein [Planctomycetes bacterium]|nr:terpene cyclase/mutase family protein [Planctomycetota bacterium]
MNSKQFHNPIGTTSSGVRAALVAGILGFLTFSAGAAQAADAKDAKRQEAVNKAVHFLSLSQAEDGSFSSRAGVGPTGLAVLALLRNGRPLTDPTLAKGLAFLEKSVQPTGGIHEPNSRIASYETCVAVLCFTEANKGGKYDALLKKADAYVRGVQWSEKDSSDFNYGGAGYKPGSRPDLSNTSFLIDALRAAGAGSDDEALKRAEVFVSRCQNLESAHNTTALAGKVNDGGFYYAITVDAKGDRGSPEGGLRSYGTMSYSGLRSMLYAGVSKDDPRVKAAISWIQKNYDVKQNPGMGTAGLFYYYHTFAKSLDALGAEQFEDAKGVKHDWRSELATELASSQKADGSWINSNRRWFENDPNLATSFALLALSYCQPK